MMSKDITYLLGTTDAIKWADEFKKAKVNNNWSLDDIDDDLMICWFSNAFMAMHDKIKQEEISVTATAIGWAYADCCCCLDKGEDPRKNIMPDVLDRASVDLGYDK